MPRFAFSILSSQDPSDKNFAEITDFSLDDWNDQKHFMELVYILATTAAAVCQLWTMINGILATILGPGLALRGPEGSMDKAVRGMALENQKTIHIFFLGIVFFHISIAFNALLTYHFITAIISVVALLFSFVWLIRHLCYGLLPKFYIAPDEVVDGRFDTTAGDASAWPRNRARYLRRQQEEKRGELQAVGKLLAGPYDNRRRSSIPRRPPNRDPVPKPQAPGGPTRQTSDIDIPTDTAHGLMLRMQGAPLQRRDGRLIGPHERARSAPRGGALHMGDTVCVSDLVAAQPARSPPRNRQRVRQGPLLRAASSMEQPAPQGEGSNGLVRRNARLVTRREGF